MTRRKKVDAKEPLTKAAKPKLPPTKQRPETVIFPASVHRQLLALTAALGQDKSAVIRLGVTELFLRMKERGLPGL